MKREHDNNILPLMSIRKINRRYSKIDTEFGSEKGEVFKYICCYCKEKTITILSCNGVIPMVIDCLKCGRGNATSDWGRTGLDDEENPEMEWYRPSMKYCLKHRRKHQKLEHVFLSGLLLKPIQ